MVIKTRNGRKTQVWYFHQQSLTIRTRYNNQSWDIKSAGKTNDMQIWSTNSGWFQIFKYTDGQFVNFSNNKVLDVKGAKDEEGRAVGVWGNNRGKHQQWRVVYLDKADAVASKGVNKDFGFHINRPFYIRSRMPMQRIIECIGANNVTLKRWRKNVAAQQWYFDNVSKTIKNNYWKSHSLDIQSNGNSANIRCTTTNSRWWQMFRYQGAFIVNERQKVLDVSGNLDQENRNIEVHNKNGGLNQQWDIMYVDEWKGEPTKGQLNEKFGLYVERDFHVVSQLPSNRYLDLINNRNMVIKTSNGRRHQVWYFHQQSLTIRTRYNNQSWDIKSAGKTNDMQIWSTNSGWFQIFVFRDEHFCNIQKSNRCLDVVQGKDQEGQAVQVHNRHNGANQRWKVLYLDKMGKMETKGLNEEFGFHINRPFYLVSELPFNRVAEMLGGTNMVLKRWRKNQRQQQFFFDEKTKTIRNNYWKNYCLDIQSNGNSNNLRTVSSINSRWWQMFRLKDQFYITNEKGKVIAVDGGIDNENRNIVMEQRNNKVHQRWRVVYVEDYEDEPTKGQLNKKFGLYVDRDFYVVSALQDGRYLDLINNRNMVIKTRNGRKTQIWYFHQPSLTIRTRYNNQSWDIKNAGKTNDMQIWSTNSGWFQIFKYENNQFINWSNNKVLDVQGGKDEEGHKVQLWSNNGSKAQKWQVVYLDKSDAIATKGFSKEFGFHINRPFYIVSELPLNKVAEMLGGTNMVLKRWRKNTRQQQFFFDNVSKTIRNNYWKNYCLDIQSNGRSNNLRTVSSINSRWWQMFRQQGDFVINEKGKVIAVSGGLDDENRNIVMEQKNGKVHQRWKIVYVDEYQGEPKKGEMNTKFGLYVDRDFHIVSAMEGNKYLDLDMSNRYQVIKTPNGRKQQVWYFHQPSLSIRSRYNNRSFDISSSGRSKTLQIWNTNNGWWQLFKFEGGSIVNFRDGRAIDAVKNDEGQKVTITQRNGQTQQLWKIVYLDKKEAEITKGLHPDFGMHCNRPFYLVSRLPMRRVAEMLGGTNITLKRFVKNRLAQRWSFDCVSKTVRSEQWKNYVMDIQNNGNSNNFRTVSSKNSRWWQMFRYQDSFFVNDHGKVMDVQSSIDTENRNIQMNTRTGKLSQQWDLIYVDKMPEEPKKGELNKEFGLYVERDFNIISDLPKHRYLEVINNKNMVIKTSNGNKGQVYYFDQNSKTIKSRLNNRSWDIVSAGKSQEFQVWSTNSGWWQLFGYEGGFFSNMWDNRVLDVYQGKDTEHQKVILYKRTGNRNQKWQVQYIDSVGKKDYKGLNKDFGFHPNRPFYFRSRLPMQRVMECIGANNLVLKRWRKNVTAQQFVFDPVSKTIRSKQWSNYGMEIQSNGGSANLRMTSGINSRWWQMFRMQGAFITNEHGKVVDVSGGVDSENRNIIVHPKHGKINQQWDIVYADEWKGEPQKGELNERFGLYVERDFYVVSKLSSNRYLDLINNRNMVIKTPNGRNTQTWYFHQQSLTIRTRYNNQSWDIQNAGRTNNMQIWSTNSGWYQIFKYENEQFVNFQNKKVLDVKGAKDEEGQAVGVWSNNGGNHQKWTVVYVDQAGKTEQKGLDTEWGFHRNRPFYIRSRMPMRRLAECVGANNVQLKRYVQNRKSQQWFFDPVTKTLKNNNWKSYSLHIQGTNVRCQPTTSRWWQLFKRQGEFVVNEKGKVLDVAGGVDNENRNIIVHQKHGKINQQWDIIYVDEWKGEPKKGELNEDFGLYVERDFHIVSQLSSNRYLDLINNRNMVIKTSNTSKTQTWFFHQPSRTIRTRNGTNQSWDIQSGGRTSNMQVWSTNSGWWQIFRYQAEHFCNIQQSDRCLDVTSSKDEEGARVGIAKRTNNANQRWKVVYTDKSTKQTKGLDKDFGFEINRPFYIQSRLPTNRVLEYQSGQNLWIKQWVMNRRQQQWVFDESRTIKPVVNKGHALSIQSHGRSNNVRYESPNSRWWQMFRYKDGNIVNEKGKVLDVHSALDVENRQVIVWNRHNGLNQQWDIVYVDEQKPEPTKGQMSPKWGFIVGRPFYIVSELKSNRHLTNLYGHQDSIIKYANGNKNQQFMFDQKTRTLLRVQNRQGWALEAKSNNNIGYGKARAIPQQQFRYKDGYIMNVKTNKVFDVSGGKDVETQKVIMYNKHNGANQRWKIVYVDQFKYAKEGMIEEFGFFANRPFYIRSQLSNGRMAECNNSQDVRLKRVQNGQTAQQWVFDPVAKIIRNKKWNNRALELQNRTNGLGNMRCINNNDSIQSRWFMQWRYDNAQIRNYKLSVSMEVYQGKDIENQNIVVSKIHGKTHQLWDIVYVDEYKGEPKKGELNEDFGFYVERPFHIISMLPRRRYLQRVDPSSHQEIVIKQPNSYKSQVWYFDQKSLTIKCQENGQSLNIHSNGSSNHLNTRNTQQIWFQQFKLDGQYIVNVQNNKVLDVHGGKDKEGNNVITWNRHNGANQKWKILYLDEKEDEPTTGLDEDSGLYRNRPFYLISRLPKHRALTVSNGRYLRIQDKKKDNQHQIFYFDHLTRTVKSKAYTAKSISIPNKGRNNALDVETTNARWWQLFDFKNGNVVNEKGKVLDVSGGADRNNQDVIVWTLHNGLNQQWDVVYTDEPEPPVNFEPNRPFVLVNMMSGKRLLTLDKSNFVIRSRDNSPEQLFKFDPATKTIKMFANQLHSLALSHSGKSRNLIAHKTDGAWYQHFVLDGKFIKNERGLVLDVSGSKDRDGQNVIVWKKNGENSLNQHWQVSYVDADTVQNGIIPDKPFRILTKMKSGRAITRSGDNVVIRDVSKSNNNDQVFVFDSETGSIQPQRDTNVSLDIGDQGRGRYSHFVKEKDVWHQHFQLKGENLINERGLVLDVAGGKDQNNQTVLVWKKHKGLNQRWKIDYV